MAPKAPKVERAPLETLGLLAKRERRSVNTSDSQMFSKKMLRGYLNMFFITHVKNLEDPIKCQAYPHVSAGCLTVRMCC